MLPLRLRVPADLLDSVGVLLHGDETVTNVLLAGAATLRIQRLVWCRVTATTRHRGLVG